jgi:hypothetical protein
LRNGALDRIDGHVSRLLAIDHQVQAWLAAGVPRHEIVRRAAIAVGLDPETFAQQFAQDMAARGFSAW